MLAGLEVSAATVAVTLRPHPRALCGETTVIARAEGRDTISSNGPSLQLDDASVWYLTLDSESCWAEERTWSKGMSSVEIVPYAKGSVRGMLDPWPKTLGRPEGVIALKLSDARPDGERVDCVIEPPAWQCTVPRHVPFDLRLQWRGFAALHYRNLELSTPTMRDVGVSKLIAGASISGRVQTPAGKPLQGAQIRAISLATQLSSAVTRSDKDGFFQLTGLVTGAYDVTSTAAGYSTADVPIDVGDGEAVDLPRVLRHQDLAVLELAVTPPLDPDGKAWNIELLSDAHSSRPIVTGITKNGQWRSERLNARDYVAVVKDARNATVSEVRVDANAGREIFVPITITAIGVEGRLLLGKRGIEGTIAFASPQDGRNVTVTTDPDGRFATSFPIAGRWKPEVRFRRGATTSRLNARSVVITDPPKDLLIVVPAGQITGVVVDSSGTPTRAAVRLRKGLDNVASQITDQEAKFDLIGLAPGDYELEAEGENAATPRPLTVNVDDDESVELRVVVEPHRKISGLVRNPDGSVASGAALRISYNGGREWYNTSADTQGRFKASLPAGSDVVIGVCTYSYPSTLVRVPADTESVNVQLDRDGGVLHVRSAGPGNPYVIVNGVFAAMNMFWFPEPIGRFDGGVFLRPGTYTVCPRPALDVQCKTQQLNVGDDLLVDLTTGD